MNIKQLYEKISQLDASHEETLLVLEREQSLVHSDIAGLKDYLSNVVDTFVRQSPKHIALVDRIFKNAGLEFSPVTYVEQVTQYNQSLRQDQAQILETARVASIDTVRTDLTRTKDALRGVNDRLTDINIALSGYDTQYTNAFSKTHGFELTPSYVVLNQNPSWWTWLTNSTVRDALYAAKKTPDFRSAFYERRALNQERDNQIDECRALTAQFNMASMNVRHYDALSNRHIFDDSVQSHIVTQSTDALRNEHFVDGLFATIKGREPDFMDHVIKLRGMEQLAAFIDGKRASLNGERGSLAPALSKLERAKRRNGSKRINQDEAQIDRAIAGSSVQGAYIIQNVRAARKDTMTYVSTPVADTSFINHWMFYQMYLGSPASDTDPHCAAHICGTHHHDGAGLPAPDYASAIQTLVASDTVQNLSLDSLGISSADLANIGNLDLGSITVDVQAAVQSVSESVTAITNTVSDVSVSNFSSGDMGGGGVSGGDAGGMCTMAFNEDVVLPNGVREMLRVGEPSRRFSFERLQLA